MLHVYISNSSTSSRKALRWLDNHHILFDVRNLSAEPLSYQDIMNILKRSIYGSKSLISHRSYMYRVLTFKKHLDLGTLSLSKLIKLLLKYPSMIRRPIIFNNKQLEIGYSQDLIRQFLPKAYKDAELHRMEHLV